MTAENITTTTTSTSIGSPRSLRMLGLRALKLVVGGVACLEVISFSLKMSMIVRAFAAPLSRPLTNWFLLYLCALVALYMGLPIACGLLVAKNKSAVKGDPRSLLWVFVLVPARLLALAFLALQLDAFHPVMAPQLLSILLIIAFYSYAFTSRQQLKRQLEAKGLILGRKGGVHNNGSGLQLEFGNGGYDGGKDMFCNGKKDSCPADVSLPPPVLIAELQVVDLKALKEEALKRKKVSI